MKCTSPRARSGLLRAARPPQSAQTYFHRRADPASADWFLAFDAAAWGKQFEEDVAAGRLDSLAEEALGDLRGGRCKDL